jgi:hypothetical protein
MTVKPQLHVDLNEKGIGALPALDRLATLGDAAFHHIRWATMQMFITYFLAPWAARMICRTW